MRPKSRSLAEMFRRAIRVDAYVCLHHGKPLDAFRHELDSYARTAGGRLHPTAPPAVAPRKRTSWYLSRNVKTSVPSG
jgi:hypothetical protein